MIPKSPLLLSLPLVAMTLTASADQRQNQRADGSYLHEVTSDFVTPHLEWAKPSVHEPISLLAITNRRFGAREIVELAQRFPIDYEAVVAANFSQLAVNSIYENQVQGTSAYEKERELMEKLDRPYGVYLLGNFSFSSLPEQAQYMILKAVAEGSGLVMFYADRFPYQKVLQQPDDGRDAILAGISLSTLPASVSGKAPHSLLETYRFGKGRIAVLNYGSAITKLGLTPPSPYNPFGWKAQYESSMALAGRVVQWAGGRETAAKATRVQPGEALAAGQAATLPLEITSPAGSQLKMRLRNDWNEVVWEGVETRQGGIQLELPALAAGHHTVDLRWEKEGKIVEVGTVDFNVTSPSGRLELKAAKESHEAGEPVELLLKIEQPLEHDAKVSLTLDDLPDHRRWAIQEATLVKGSRELRITLPAPHVPTITALLRAKLSVGGQPVTEEHTVLYFPRREIELFPTILWDNIPGELAEMSAEQVRSATSDAAALTHPGHKGVHGERSAYFNQRFVPYTTRIGLAAGEKGETQSKFWLGMTADEITAGTQGDGSFHNPAVREFWKKTISRRMEGLPKMGPMIYTLGDENFFSYEAGYSPADQAAFPLFLKELYGSVEKLNTAWGTRFASFDAVGHPSPAEMRDQELYPQWYAHRRFMEQQYADVHHGLAEMIREIDPHAIVGAEGSVPGDLELTISKLEFWGPYKDIIYDELLRTIGAEKLRAVWWGYGGEFMAYPLWTPLLKGIVNGNQWYSSSIEAVSGFTAADFTMAKYYREDRKPYVDRLEAGPAQLLVSTPLKQSDIAILWSHASYSASLMNDRFFTPRDAAAPLLEFCYQEGLNADLITSSMLKSGALGSYRVLFLPGASALGQEEVAAIENFVQKGGLVVADLNPGILNDSCGPRETSALGKLFGLPEFKGAAALEMKPVKVEAALRGRTIHFEAEKAMQSPEVPLFKVQNHGAGSAILLNFNLSSARNTASSSFDTFLRELFEAGGAKAGVKITGIDRARSVLKMRQKGDYELLGFLAAPSEIGKTARFALPEQRWIYEVNTGILGNGSAIDAKLDVPFKLYSLFPRPMKSPKWSLSNGEVKPGEPVSIETGELEANGVYRLELYAPDGELLKQETRVFAGRDAGAPLRFAFNDAMGRYRLKLTDVRTGLHHDAELTLKAAPLTSAQP